MSNYKPGDSIELLLFNHPDHKFGIVREVIPMENGDAQILKVERADGIIIDIDPDFDDIRLTDKSLDERLENLSNDDLQDILDDKWSDLRFLRPGPLYVRMAKELLELRKKS